MSEPYTTKSGERAILPDPGKDPKVIESHYSFHPPRQLLLLALSEMLLDVALESLRAMLG